MTAVAPLLELIPPAAARVLQEDAHPNSTSLELLLTVGPLLIRPSVQRHASFKKIRIQEPGEEEEEWSDMED